MAGNETQLVARGDRWFWPAWGAAFLGFPIAGSAAAVQVGPIEWVGAAVIAGAVAGGVIGAAQWLVLRRRLRHRPLAELGRIRLEKVSVKYLPFSAPAPP